MNIIAVYKRFPTQQDCIAHLEQVKWNGTPICPYCKSKNQTPLPKEQRYHCNTCNTSFSVTVGTIFHKTKLDLQRWFLAISLVLNAKKGYSARQLGRDLDVNKNTAWFLFMRIRKSFIDEPELMKGIIEADETFVGGKNKNRHKNKKKDGGQGGANHALVIGVLERGGKVKAKKAKDRSGKTLGSFVRANVKEGSTVSTDEWKGYNNLSAKFSRLVVNHGEGEYVNGEAHTNTLEGFWALFKRGIVGQYHQISTKYLDRYVDEFCFRYNARKIDPFQTFETVLSRALK